MRKRSGPLTPESTVAIADTASRLLDALQKPGMPNDATVSQLGVSDTAADGWKVTITPAGRSDEDHLEIWVNCATSTHLNRLRKSSWYAIADAINVRLGSPGIVELNDAADGSTRIVLVLAIAAPSSFLEAFARNDLDDQDDDEELSILEDVGIYRFNAFWNRVYAKPNGRPLAETSRSFRGYRKRASKRTTGTDVAVYDAGQTVPHAGEYWRVKREALSEARILDLISQKNGGYPDDPVLLVKDVRYVGNAPHSIELAPHPQANRDYETVVLCTWFVERFAPAPDGVDVRRREIGLVERGISSISEDIQRGPTSEDLLALPAAAASVAEGHREVDEGGVQAGGGGLPAIPVSVPEVFARSSGLLAHAKTQLDLATKRAAWLTQCSQAIQLRTNWLAGFHQERAVLALAGLAEQRREIDDLLKGIKSLEIYNGVGVQIEQIIEGDDAPPDEQLVLLQRKLYMDVEFLVDLSTGGADWTHFSSFADVLTQRQDLLDRVLPFPRCVVAMRYRREDKNYYPGINAANLFEAWGIAKKNDEKNEPNRETFLLIRNGDNVYHVFSEVVTNTASRLFPTRDEFDKPFRGMRFFGEDDRQPIAFDDVEYYDANETSEQLRQQYKNVMILLWGLNDRLHIFGEFYDPMQYSAQGFLDFRLQMDRFRFITDEENLLTEGRPTMTDWLAGHNRMITSGSRILVDWKSVVNDDSTRQLFRFNRYCERLYQFAHPTRDISMATVYLRNGELCVDMEIEFERGTKRKTSTTPILLKKVDVFPGSARRMSLLNLDGLQLGDLDYYLGTRENRENYIRYWRLFATAREQVVRDDGDVATLRKRLRDFSVHAGFTDEAANSRRINETLRLWRVAHRGATPKRDDQLSLQRILFCFHQPSLAREECERLAQGLGRSVYRVTVNGIGRLEIEMSLLDSERLPYGLDRPWIARAALYHERGKKWVIEPAIHIVDWNPDEGSRATLLTWPAAGTLAPVSLLAPADDDVQLPSYHAIEKILAMASDAGNLAYIRAMLGDGKVPYSAKSAIDKTREFGGYRTRGKIVRPKCAVPIGIVVKRAEYADGERFRSWSLLWASIDAFALLYQRDTSSHTAIESFWNNYAHSPTHHIDVGQKNRLIFTKTELGAKTEPVGMQRHCYDSVGAKPVRFEKKGRTLKRRSGTVEEAARGEAYIGYQGRYRIMGWLSDGARRLGIAIMAAALKDTDDE